MSTGLSGGWYWCRIGVRRFAFGGGGRDGNGVEIEELGGQGGHHEAETAKADVAYGYGEPEGAPSG